MTEPLPRVTETGPVESTKKETSRGGERKKVVAENGKVLIVDGSGNVFLVEENENGETEEFLLDVGLHAPGRGNVWANKSCN